MSERRDEKRQTRREKERDRGRRKMETDEMGPKLWTSGDLEERKANTRDNTNDLKRIEKLKDVKHQDGVQRLDRTQKLWSQGCDWSWNKRSRLKEWRKTLQESHHDSCSSLESRSTQNTHS